MQINIKLLEKEGFVVDIADNHESINIYAERSINIDFKRIKDQLDGAGLSRTQIEILCEDFAINAHDQSVVAAIHRTS